MVGGYSGRYEANVAFNYHQTNHVCAATCSSDPICQGYATERTESDSDTAKCAQYTAEGVAREYSSVTTKTMTLHVKAGCSGTTGTDCMEKFQEGVVGKIPGSSQMLGGKVIGGTAAECEAACLAKAVCTAYSYGLISGQGQCYMSEGKAGDISLKNTTAYHKRFETHMRFSACTGDPTTTTATTTSAPPTSCSEFDTGVPGKTSGTVQIGPSKHGLSATQCAEACLAAAQCVAYSYGDANGKLICKLAKSALETEISVTTTYDLKFKTHRRTMGTGTGLNAFGSPTADQKGRFKYNGVAGYAAFSRVVATPDACAKACLATTADKTLTLDCAGFTFGSDSQAANTKTNCRLHTAAGVAKPVSQADMTLYLATKGCAGTTITNPTKDDCNGDLLRLYYGANGSSSKEVGFRGRYQKGYQEDGTGGYLSMPVMQSTVDSCASGCHDTVYMMQACFSFAFNRATNTCIMYTKTGTVSDHGGQPKDGWDWYIKGTKCRHP